jgi:mRNA interferase RelE/StbE
VPEYRVALTPAAQRQLTKLRGATLLALRGVILALGEDPQPSGARRLIGTVDLWRVRVSVDGVPWRVVYQLRSGERMVIVTRVVRRDEGTYRRLPR